MHGSNVNVCIESTSRPSVDFSLLEDEALLLLLPLLLLPLLLLLFIEGALGLLIEKALVLVLLCVRNSHLRWCWSVRMNVIRVYQNRVTSSRELAGMQYVFSCSERINWVYF